MTQHFWKMPPCKIRVPRNCLCHNTQLSRSLSSIVTNPGLCTTSHGTADVYDVTEHARQMPAIVYWSLMTSWAELLKIIVMVGTGQIR
jgi:hypothetical protein